jgi:hypothetical protein
MVRVQEHGRGQEERGGAAVVGVRHEATQGIGIAWRASLSLIDRVHRKIEV